MGNCKYILMAIAIVAMCSCRTVKETAVTLDKSHATDEIIYDLAESYNIPDIGTVYDYNHKATVVSSSEYVGYKVKVNNKWYETNRIVYYKYKKGDRITNQDFNKIKQ